MYSRCSLTTARGCTGATSVPVELPAGSDAAVRCDLRSMVGADGVVHSRGRPSRSPSPLCDIHPPPPSAPPPRPAGGGGREQHHLHGRGLLCRAGLFGARRPSGPGEVVTGDPGDPGEVIPGDTGGVIQMR